ncbi:MAG: tetratricopeptide repeat protein [Planctomycetota bacterium]|jgi:tetratricopeptide (TPR) repeat protein
MRICKPILAAIVASLTIGSSLLAADPAGEANALYEDGLALLAQGDFAGAAKALGAAAQADPEESSYRQHAALVRRVVQLRTMHDQQSIPARWSDIAKSLRAFYYEYRLFNEALALDEKAHEKLNTAESAAALGETQLELELNERAAEFLAGLDENRVSPRSRVLLGIALARLDRIDEAKAIAAKCVVPKEPDPAMCFDMACLQALLGQRNGAAKMLTRCFESTPPSLLEATKDRARQREDLNGLATSTEHEGVWLTASRVKESSCSGGTSCGACPSAKTCKPGHPKGGK